jgi:hypothetical protein
MARVPYVTKDQLPSTKKDIYDQILSDRQQAESSVSRLNSFSSW